MSDVLRCAVRLPRTGFGFEVEAEDLFRAVEAAIKENPAVHYGPPVGVVEGVALVDGEVECVIAIDNAHLSAGEPLEGLLTLGGELPLRVFSVDVCRKGDTG